MSKSDIHLYRLRNEAFKYQQNSYNLHLNLNHRMLYCKNETRTKNGTTLDVGQIVS